MWSYELNDTKTIRRIVDSKCQFVIFVESRLDLVSGRIQDSSSDLFGNR